MLLNDAPEKMFSDSSAKHLFGIYMLFLIILYLCNFINVIYMLFYILYTYYTNYYNVSYQKNTCLRKITYPNTNPV